MVRNGMAQQLRLNQNEDTAPATTAGQGFSRPSLLMSQGRLILTGAHRRPITSPTTTRIAHEGLASVVCLNPTNRHRAAIKRQDENGDTAVTEPAMPPTTAKPQNERLVPCLSHPTKRHGAANKIKSRQKKKRTSSAEPAMPPTTIKPRKSNVLSLGSVQSYKNRYDAAHQILSLIHI